MGFRVGLYVHEGYPMMKGEEYISLGPRNPWLYAHFLIMRLS